MSAQVFCKEADESWFAPAGRPREGVLEVAVVLRSAVGEGCAIMARWHVFFLIFCLAIFANCGGGTGSGSNINPGDPPPMVSLSGSVAFKGAPLVGAAVTNFLTNSNVVYKTATTGANGNYSFSGMSTGGDVPGEYQIFVNEAGYGFYPSVGSGAKVMRADYTGQYAAPGTVPPSGLFFHRDRFCGVVGQFVDGGEFCGV